MLSVDEVKQVINSGGLAYPYPRRGQISLNGGRGQAATKQAINFAQLYIKELKGNKP